MGIKSPLPLFVRSTSRHPRMLSDRHMWNRRIFGDGDHLLARFYGHHRLARFYTDVRIKPHLRRSRSHRRVEYLRCSGPQIPQK